MIAGNYIYTPRFCTVKIETVFESIGEAKAEGYTEPTHYESPHYDILGKHTGINRMVFAAAKKIGKYANPTCNCGCIDCERFYSCESPLKISESDRDYWIEQRDLEDENSRLGDFKKADESP